MPLIIMYYVRRFASTWSECVRTHTSPEIIPQIFSTPGNCPPRGLFFCEWKDLRPRLRTSGVVVSYFPVTCPVSKGDAVVLGCLGIDTVDLQCDSWYESVECCLRILVVLQLTCRRCSARDVPATRKQKKSYLYDNGFTTLPEGIFEDLTNLEKL